MPRIVDHDQRRQELAGAAWRLICREGLAALTIRRLAQESGWSSGSIRHYLPDRQAIVAFASSELQRAFEGHLQDLPLGDNPRANLTALLQRFLPTTPATREWARVWLAFVADAAAEHPATAGPGIVYSDLRELLVAVADDLAGHGLLRGQPAAAATAWQAHIDGLSVHLLLGVLDPEAAAASLERLAADWVVE